MSKKYGGYNVHWQHHVQRAQAADALQHQHSMGMAPRQRLRWADSDEYRKQAMNGCACSSDTGACAGCDNPMCKDCQEKRKKEHAYAGGESMVDMGSVATALEEVQSEPSVETSTPEPEPAEEPVGAPAAAVEATNSPSSSSSEQFVMLGEDAPAIDEAVELSKRIDSAVEQHGNDFETQPPMSEHFVRALHALVSADAFDPASQFQKSAMVIVKEKLMAGDAGFRNVAVKQLGEEACGPMFAVVDRVLQTEQE